MQKEIRSLKQNKSFRITIVIIILFVVLVGIGLSIIYYKYYQSVLDNQKNQQLIISREVAKELEREVEQSQDDLRFLIQSGVLADEKEEYLTDKNKEQILKNFELYMETYSPYISNLLYTQNDLTEEPLVSLIDTSYKKINDVSTMEQEKISLWVDEHKQMTMSIKAETDSGYVIYVMLNLQEIYQKTISNIKLGEKGYVLIKDAEGTIIMHQLQEQIGINARTDREILYPDLNIESTGFKSMIDNQMQGKEGVEIYKSYWWADQEPELVKKISAYSPCNIGNGFLIVSAVIDYAEISNPLVKGNILIALLSLVIFGGFTYLFIIIIKGIHRRDKIKQENKTLKELNQTLQTLHENEQIMAHQQRLQIIGTMTGGISHEFNNLLTPIMGYAGLMLGTMEKDNEYYEDALEIYDSAEKAKEIIQQISTLSKRNMDTVYKYCDVEQLLKRVSKMAKSIKPPNIELQIQGDKVTRGVYGNPTQLNQVILNLFVNAIHAIGTNEGRIVISYKELFQDEIQKLLKKEWKSYSNKEYTEYEEISIQDNGCGMDEITLSNIFDPFFTTKSEAGGTGLGLFIVQNIVAVHRGFVLVESQCGVGTTFRLILPTIAAKTEKKEQPKHLETVKDFKPANISILVVDDNSKVLKVLEKGLKKEGFIVKALGTPLEALEELEHRNYNIIITDDFMKDMSGLSLAQKVKQTNQELPIIVLTGLLRKEIVEAKQSHMISEYLVKPIAICSMVEVINDILGKS